MCHAEKEVAKRRERNKQRKGGGSERKKDREGEKEREKERIRTRTDGIAAKAEKKSGLREATLVLHTESETFLLIYFPS